MAFCRLYSLFPSTVVIFCAQENFCLRHLFALHVFPYDLSPSLSLSVCACACTHSRMYVVRVTLKYQARLSLVQDLQTLPAKASSGLGYFFPEAS